uniref:Uncharacterized protein n=1 Tax=Vibrio crassostreae TaxID=246167 RepID=A0A0H3ZWA5_9VIBR|nr:hypothetical protein [Vibrio crassostreae]
MDRSTLPTERDYNEWRELVEAETGEKLPERPNWISTKKAQTNRQVRELNNAVKKSVKADAMIGLQLEDVAELADMV